jgi:hypothetical protein
MNKVISQDEDPQSNPNTDKEAATRSEPQAGLDSDRRRPSHPPGVGTDDPQETLALSDDPTQDGETDPAVKIAVDSDVPLFPTVPFDSVPAEESQTVVLARQVDTGDFSVDARTQGRVRSSQPDDRATRISAIRAPDARMPGKVGNYTIQRVLGRGGVGVVYLAHQVDLNREVALKMVLAGGHASEAQSRKRSRSLSV